MSDEHPTKSLNFAAQEASSAELVARGAIGTDRDTTPPIKEGDLLYAVGPAHNPPHDAADLCVYSAVVTSVQPEGSFSSSATDTDRASGPQRIAVALDRPVLGFPKWCYLSYEIGHSVHRSAADALRAFTTQATYRRNKAAHDRAAAAAELTWAGAQIDRQALGRWHLGRPSSDGGVIYVSDSLTGVPHQGTACFTCYGNSAEETEALAQLLLDLLHAHDIRAEKGTP